jgi:putative glutamine amidotransferase
VTRTVILGWPKPDYCRALERAGATVAVVGPESDPVPRALDRCHGVLLTGGADVDPSFYGDAERHPTIKVDPERDEYEIALARGAMERDLPILAICRGVQLLNVAAGGTLIQDIPSQRPGSLNHSVKEPPTQKVHTVRIVPESRLGRLLLTGTSPGPVEVNSRHHQAVNRVAPGFIVSAVAPDGIIEAIERPDATFCVGVQWHPENYWATGEFQALFEGFGGGRS